MRYIIITITAYVLWVSLSTGGLYEFKQINPDYAHPDRSAAYLVGRYYLSGGDRYIDKLHVERCSLYMPNWAKAEACVRVMLSCEYASPVKRDIEIKDLYSDWFRECRMGRIPFRGGMEWLRASRSFFRIGVTWASMWLAGGFDGKGGEGSEAWDKKNKWWAEPLLGWAERGG